MNALFPALLISFAAAAALISCKPNVDDLPPPTSFNGFMINSTSYEVDSITLDPPARGNAMHLHSGAAGGGVLTITGDSTMRWPTSDGSYLYGFSYVRPRVKGTVSACFKPNSGTAAAFCVSEEHMPYNTPALQLTITGGNRSISMDARPDRYDSVANMLTISFTEK